MSQRLQVKQEFTSTSKYYVRCDRRKRNEQIFCIMEGWMRFDEKLGVYTNMETGTMEFVMIKEKIAGSIAIEGM